MIRFFQIAVFSCSALSLLGCGRPEKVALPQKLKITDLAPTAPGKELDQMLLKPINLDVHIFEIPAENITKLDDVWNMLYLRPLKFNSYQAFCANSFVVRFGQIPIWSKIMGSLIKAEAQKMITISLLLQDGQENDVTVVGLNRQQTIFYVAASGAMKQANIGPGVLALRVQANKIPTSRGLCAVMAQPVFLPPIGAYIPQLSARAKAGEFAFNSAAFSLNMGPGDFVLLGPEKYISDQITLGSFFFSKPEGSLFLSEGKPPERKPSIRKFLLVCIDVGD